MISVILPVYNASKYIEDTLNSLLNQTFDDFEIIIINDGSKDNSLNIIKNTLKDSKIPYNIINQENKGVSNARNKGMELAKGKYIVFVDDDDLVDKNHLSCLFENAKDNDGSFTQMIKINENGDILENTNKFTILEGKTKISALDLIKLELTMEIPFSFCQIMYKKDLIHEKFDENLFYGEDTEFALKNLIYMENIGICNKNTYFYRQNTDSTTSKLNFKRFEIVEVFKELKEFYKKHGFNNLANLIEENRIPKAIFGNLMYFFYNNYDYSDIINEMNRLNLFEKLKNFKGDNKFNLKIKLFLLNPRIYYILWKKFKDRIL